MGLRLVDCERHGCGSRVQFTVQFSGVSVTDTLQYYSTVVTPPEIKGNSSRPAAHTYCWRCVAQVKAHTTCLEPAAISRAQGCCMRSVCLHLQWWSVVSPMVALSNTMAVSQCLNVLSRPLHEQTHVLLVSQIWDSALRPLYTNMPS